MPGRLNVESLLGLLQEQRREVATRSEQERGSAAWDASCERLDKINERIMRSPSDQPGSIRAARLAWPPSAPADRGRAGH